MNLGNYLDELNKWYGSIHVDNHSEPVPMLKQIEQHLGLTFVAEPFDPTQGSCSNVCMINSPEIRDEYRETFAPIDLLNYIYAVLYSPSYREKHKEFLKIDFQKVPFPRNTTTFWQLVRLGGQLRQLHLLESPKVEEYITGYSEDGSNEITTKIGIKDWELFDVQNQVGRVWINDTQFFDKIPLTTWELYMGGHQPAQKWLKDRRGRTLDFEDILHYQKIIVALAETHLLMQEIDTIRIE
ncbi:MAG: type ISP restriction/modification enzyme [Maribacter sp.]|uniref:type ISP restriction/modification enzyme n=1 Tax=Maribacter sp. TaxID=1897614 RepID=UPI003C7691DA